MLLNVEADHLDRHGTLEDYLAAKLQIFARQGNDDVAVAPAGLAVQDLGGCARRVPFGPGGELDDRAGHLWWDGEPLIAHEEIRLRGAHNRANAAAAAAIALARGLDADAVRAGLRTFAGVEHRLEEVVRAGDVLFVNDSKATNVASTLVALASFATRPSTSSSAVGKGSGFRGEQDDESKQNDVLLLLLITKNGLGDQAQALPRRPARLGRARCIGALSARRETRRPHRTPTCMTFERIGADRVKVYLAVEHKDGKMQEETFEHRRGSRRSSRGTPHSVKFAKVRIARPGDQQVYKANHLRLTLCAQGFPTYSRSSTSLRA